MLEELLNSKMFWLGAAAIAGLIIGGIIKSISRSKLSGTAISIPVIAIFVTLLILRFVKLNVEYYNTRYTLFGIGVMIVIASVFGYIMYRFNDKKIGFLNNLVFMYAVLSIIIFYIFYKSELKIDLKNYEAKKDIILLLKKEDAGYFEINEYGIGYVGNQQFLDGFRPKFIGGENLNSLYDLTPYAVELKSKSGTAHALWFKPGSNQNEAPNINLDELIEDGQVKPEELKFGDLKSDNKN